MAYSFGTLAISTGRYARKTDSACLRARETDMCEAAGRIGAMPDRDSSVASKSAAWRRKASARRFETVARYDCTNTLIRTISAEGEGRSSGTGDTCSTLHLGAASHERHLKIDGYRHRNPAANWRAAVSA